MQNGAKALDVVIDDHVGADGVEEAPEMTKEQRRFQKKKMKGLKKVLDRIFASFTFE